MNRNEWIWINSIIHGFINGFCGYPKESFLSSRLSSFTLKPILMTLKSEIKIVKNAFLMSFESNQVQDEKYTELIQNWTKEFE